MKSLIRSLVVGIAVGAIAFGVSNLAQAGPTYAQRRYNEIKAAETRPIGGDPSSRSPGERKIIEANRRKIGTTPSQPAPNPTPDPYQPGEAAEQGNAKASLFAKKRNYNDRDLPTTGVTKRYLEELERRAPAERLQREREREEINALWLQRQQQTVPLQPAPNASPAPNPKR